MRYMRGYGFMSEFNNKLKIPGIAVYKDKQLHYYNSYTHFPLALYFINKALYPVLELKSSKEIYRYSDLFNEYEEQNEFYEEKYITIGLASLGKPYRSLMLVKDKEEFKSQIKQYRKIAQKMSYRIELRFAICSKPDIIDEVKKIHPEWFNKYLSNSIVLFRGFSNDFIQLDLADFDLYYLENWINEESASPVIPINSQTYPMFEKINTPKIVAYTNTHNYFYISEMLKRVSKVNINFIFAHSSEESAPHPDVRCLASFKSGETYIFPINETLTDESLKEFVWNISNHIIYPDYVISSIEQGEKVTKMLKHTKHLRLEQFDQFINSGRDSLIFFVDTKATLASEKSAEIFESLAVRLVNETNVRLMYFDLLFDKLPIGLENLTTPAVLLYHPTSNPTNYIKMNGNIDEEALMRFLLKNSGLHHYFKNDL
jgi:hypothetical protein